MPNIQIPNIQLNVVDMTNVYPDQNFAGPSFVYQPAGQTQYYQFQLYRATTDSSGRTSTTFKFNSGAPAQPLYLPYVVPAQPPSTASPTNTEANVQTHGLSGCATQPKLAGPYYYQSFDVTLTGTAIPACRHVAFGMPLANSPTDYVPTPSCVAESSNATGSPNGFILNLPGNVQVCYVWRQITTTCNTGTCPNGYAAGPVDFLLQYGA